MKTAVKLDILTVPQAATLLQSSTALIYRLLKSGQLKGKRIGKKEWRITRNQVLKMCGEQE